MANPYELRFNMLALAKDRLAEKFFADLEVWKLSEEGSIVRLGGVPKYPSLDEIREEAEELRAFVESK